MNTIFSVRRAALPLLFTAILVACSITTPMPIPTASATTIATSTATSVPPTETPTPQPSETPTATATPDPQKLLDAMSDEGLLASAPQLTPEDYGLAAEMVLTPDKVIKDGFGGLIILYKNPSGRYQMAWNNSEGIQFTNGKIEGGIVEHAVYAEYEGGSTVMILTPKEVVEQDGGWFKLDPNDPEAENKFATAFNMGLAMTWWGQTHREDNSVHYNQLYSLAKVDKFKSWAKKGKYIVLNTLSNNQRRQMVDYIFQEFLKARAEAQTNGVPLEINLPSRPVIQIDAAGDMLID